MDLSRVLRTPIIVEAVTQDGAPDEMGDPTEELVWTRYLGAVWQTGASEVTANTATASETWQLALDRSAAGTLAAGSRVYVDGELDTAGDYVAGTGEAFDVEGPPWPARNPRTLLVEYVQARIVRST